MFEPIEGCRYDSGMLRESGLVNQLESLPDTSNGKTYCIYGDPAYLLRPQLLAPYKGENITADQREFNKEMSGVRIVVEWAYVKVLQLFPFVDFKKNQKLLLQPIAAPYYTAVLLTNCHRCVPIAEINTFLNIEPPRLEEYLSLVLFIYLFC